MTTKSAFTQQFRSNLARLALSENSYYIGIAQTDPWPNEIDEISENPNLPNPYLLTTKLQGLIGLVCVKAIQLLVPLESVKYPKGLALTQQVKLREDIRYNTLIVFQDFVWLYSQQENLLVPLIFNNLATQSARTVISELELPQLLCSDVHGYLYGIVEHQTPGNWKLVKYTNTAKSFKASSLPALNEVQIIRNIGAVSGLFFLSFNGSSTIPLPYNITPNDLQPLLEALPDIGIGNVSCTSLEGSNEPLNVSPIKVEFVGSLSNTQQPLLESTNLTLVGNTPTIRIARERVGLSQHIVALAATDYELTCLNEQGYLITFDAETLDRSTTYSEIDLRDLLSLPNNIDIVSHCYYNTNYLLVLTSDLKLNVLDVYTYTQLAVISVDIPANDPSRVLSIAVLQDKLYVLTEQNLFVYSIEFELENFTIFEYGNDKFVGVNKRELNQKTFGATYLGWYAEILPGQLPTSVFRQTVLLNNVVFKPGVDVNKSAFLASEVEHYETVFISNHEPQIINSDTYKLLKVVKAF